MELIEQLNENRDARVELLCGQLNTMLKDGRLQINNDKVEEIKDKTRITLPIASAGSVQVKLDAGVVPSAATAARYGFRFLKWATGW